MKKKVPEPDILPGVVCHGSTHQAINGERLCRAMTDSAHLRMAPPDQTSEMLDLINFVLNLAARGLDYNRISFAFTQQATRNR